MDPYVSALAERGIPAIASGGELAEERELMELKIVLEAIADPDNPVAVLAAVTGLFFGVSPEAALNGLAAGERLSITAAPHDPAGALGAALGQLHDWALKAADEPADQLLDRILDDSGLLPLAASTDQGNSRAGTLLYLVDAIRSTDLPSGITDAIRRIADTIERSEATPSLEPGRSDVVRVMNVHKAKGLEAPVVILAAPVTHGPRTPELHVRRGATGRPEGATRIVDPSAPDGPRQAERAVITQPAGWQAWEDEERAMLDAEWDRLLYVAVTRAKDELVVALDEDPDKETTWSRLRAALVDQGEAIELPVDPPTGRPLLAVPAAEMGTRVQETEARRARAAARTVRFTTVSEEAKGELRFEREFDRRREERPEVTLGRSWGRVVHRTIEAMGRGRRGDALDAFIRAVVADEFRDADEVDRAGRISALGELVATLRGSAEWQALEASADGCFELPVTTWAAGEGEAAVTEGVIDAACRDGSSWTVFDWKTDRPELYAGREEGYRRQVEDYSRMLARVSGQAAEGRLVPLGGGAGGGPPAAEGGGQLRLL